MAAHGADDLESFSLSHHFHDWDLTGIIGPDNVVLSVACLVGLDVSFINPNAVREVAIQIVLCELNPLLLGLLCELRLLLSVTGTQLCGVEHSRDCESTDIDCFLFLQLLGDLVR